MKKILGVLSGERSKGGKSMGTAKLVRAASGSRVGAKLIVKPPTISVPPPAAPLRLPKIQKTKVTKHAIPLKVISPGGIEPIKPGSSKTRGGSLKRGSVGLRGI